MTTADKSRRIAVVVLGMHRSGTSALTRVLNLLGCDLPSNLHGAGTGNETGHWEPSSVIAVNERLLPSAGSYMHDWQAISEGWLESPKAQVFLDDAIAALKADYSGSSFFVLKEPRICRVFPLWKQALVSEGVAPVVMIPVRNPVEVAESLRKRDGFDPSWGYLMWLRNVVDAERDSRGLPRHFSTYDQLLENWGVVAKGAQAALGVKWPIPFDKAEPEVERFLSKSQRHNVSDQAKVLDNPLMSPWIRDVYGIMLRWAATGEDKSDWALLDRVHAEMAAAEPAFGRAVAAGWGAALWGRQLDQKQAEIRTEMENKQQAIAKAEKSVSALTVTNAELQASLDEAKAQLADREAQLAAAVQERNDLLGEVVALRQAHKTAEQRLAVRFLEIVKLTELAQRREDERVMTHAAMTGAQAKLAALEAEKGRLEAEAAARLAALQAEMERLEAEASARLAASHAERALLEEQGVRNAAEALAKLGHLNAQAAQLRDEARRNVERNQRTIEAIATLGQNSLIPDRVLEGLKASCLARTGLFDADFYRETYADIAAGGIDPLMHFVRHGAKEGRLWSRECASLPGDSGTSDAASRGERQ